MQAPPSLGVKMAKSEQSWGIPTQLSLEQFRQFVLPHLTVGRRGPAPKLSLHTVFNYILKILYLGCQWKELPIAKDADGRPEIHYTRIYGAFRRWQAGGCFDVIFITVVLRLRQTNHLDVTIIHGDGTTWKLISCLHGVFYLVVVNNDRESPQYRQWAAFTLSDTNHLQVLVPPKFGNGHLVLSERAVFHYKQTTEYNRAGQFTLPWNDPTLKIWWPTHNPIVSERDQGV